MANWWETAPLTSQITPAPAPAPEPAPAPSRLSTVDAPPRAPSGRQMVPNADGSVSTERTVTGQWGPNGEWVNVPSMYDGRQVSEEEAARRARENNFVDPETGRTLPFYSTVDEAVAAAQARSNRLGQEIEASQAPGWWDAPPQAAPAPGPSTWWERAPLAGSQQAIPREHAPARTFERPQDRFMVPDVPPADPNDRSVGLGSLGRGFNRLQQVGAMAGYEAGLYTSEEAARMLARDERDMARYPMSPAVEQGMREWQASEGWWDAVKAVANNPAALASVTGESLVTSIPPLVLGAVGLVTGTLTGGPVGGIVGAGAGGGAGSFGIEYAISMTDAMREAGVDLTDERQIRAAFETPEILEAGREKGIQRGIPIAVMDALSMGLAGRIAGPVARALEGRLGSTGANIAGGGAEVGAQAVSGASGEAGAQLVSEGRITSPAEVLVEGAAEIVTGIPEIAMGANAPAPATGQPPPIDPATGLPVGAQPAEMFIGEEEADGATVSENRDRLREVLDDERPIEEVVADEVARSQFALSDDWQVLPKGLPVTAEMETRMDPATGRFVVRRRPAPGTRAAPVDLQTPEDVNLGAEQTAPPTPGQADAGNYAKRHVTWDGLDITIETEQDQERTGLDQDGRPWSARMPAPYGYIKRSAGNDGEQVDVYIGPEPASERVFMVDQIDPQTRAFDEHKALIGFPDIESARATYEAGFSDGSGPLRLGSIREMTRGEFKLWLSDKENTGPVAYQEPVDAGLTAKQAAALRDLILGGTIPLDPQKVARELDVDVKTVRRVMARLSGQPGTGIEQQRNGRFRRTPKRTNPLNIIEFLASHGGIRDDRGELAARDLGKRGQGFVPGMGPLMRPAGMSLDYARELAEESGYLAPGADGGTSTINDLLDAIDNTLRGSPVFSVKDLQAVADQEAAQQAQEFERQLKEMEAAVDAFASEMDLNLTPEEREAALSLMADGMDAENAVEEVIMRAGLALDAEATEALGADNDIPFDGEQDEQGQGGAGEAPAQAGVGQGQGAQGGQAQGNAQGGEQSGEAGAQVELTPAGQQTLIPGVAPVRDKDRLDVEVNRPMGSGRPQQEPGGLFSGEVNQTDLEDFTREPQEAGTQPQEEPAEASETETDYGTVDNPNVEALSDEFFEAFLLPDMEFRSIVQARQFAAGFLGVKNIAAGTPAAKAVDEAVELGAVKAARFALRALERGRDPAIIFDRLNSINARMPKLSTRTSTSMQNQAYSTPLPIAFVASQLANVREAEAVYEPSAGNGALLMEADPSTQSVYANEIDPARAYNLDGFDFRVSRADATQDAALPPVKVDVVIANPPFGKVGGKRWPLDARNSTPEIDHAIAFKSLEAMADDGRAVLIVGGVNPQATSPKARADLYARGEKMKFYRRLYDTYNVVEIFTVSGKLYERQGASWPVDIIVIDGRGPSEMQVPAKAPPPVIETWDQLKRVLKDGHAQGTAAAAGQAGAPAAQANTGGAVGNNQPDAGDVGGTARPGDTGDSGRPDQQAGGGTGGAGRPVRGGQPDGDGPRAGGTDQPRGDQDVPDGTEDTGGAGADRPGAGTPSLTDEDLDAAWEKAKQAEKGEGEPAPQKAPSRPPRTAGQAAASAVRNTAEGADAALDALVALFRDPNKLGSGPSFDEETYARAKPLFIRAIAKFREAARDIVDMMRAIIRDLKKRGLDDDEIDRMEPYVKRFIRDVQSGEINLDEAPQAAPPAQQPRAPRAPKQSPAPSQPEIDTTGRQEAHTPKSKINPMGTLVPANLKDPMADALAALEERVGDVDQFVANELGITHNELGDYLGGEQIDGIALAISAFKDGTGLIIGDQTGIGKGRQVAAVLRWAMRNGKTPIFVTETPTLFADMYRDLVDVGIKDMLGREPKMLMTNNNETVALDEERTKFLKSAAKKEHEAELRRVVASGGMGGYDIIFTTYSQMQEIAGKGTERQSFLSAMARRNAVMVFDESHNAGGTGGQKRGRGGGDDDVSPIGGRAGFARQLIAEADAVLYSSATYAKRPDVMDLYSKTDMRLAVDNILQLGSLIASGGVPMQQVVASLLARVGQYVRRERSYDGIQYDTPVVEVDKVGYNDFSASANLIHQFSEYHVRKAVQAIRDELQGEGNVLPDGSTGQAGATSTGFTSVLHNLVSQFLLSLKAERAADMAIASLKGDEKPVITLANTNESMIEEFAEMAGLKPGDAVNVDFRALLQRYLDRSRTITKTTAYGEKTKHYMTDHELGPAGVAAYKAAQERIDKMQAGLPLSPIDAIRNRIEAAGYSVGEITGRSMGINYGKNETTLYRRATADTKPDGRRRIISEFNSGKTDALILNQAGSTGISLHASMLFKDQRKRHMILAQPELNIDTHMQMLGRVHRTGQVIKPRYSQLIADVPAEKRPAAVLAKKMASLNANTTAARDSAFTSKDVPDFMNEYGDKVAAQAMNDAPDLHESLGAPLKEDQHGFKEEDAMRKVTGRLPLLPLDRQEEVYEILQAEYEMFVQQMEASGQNALEAKTLDLDANVLDVTEIKPSRGASPFADAVYLERLDVKRIGKPMTPEQVLKTIKQHNPDMPIPDDIDEMTGKQVEETFKKLPVAGATEAGERGRAARAEFNAYKDEMLSDISDAKKQEAQEVRLDAIWKRWNALNGLVSVGRQVILKGDEGNLYGVVMRIHQQGTAKNPVALGQWKATIALADASRQIVIPFSQLYTADTAPATPSRTQMEIAGTSTGPGGGNMIEAFYEAQVERREERYMVTGNLLAGYDAVKGKGVIVNFRDSEGRLRQGIMQSRQFAAQKFVTNLPVKFDAAADAIEFARRTGLVLNDTMRIVGVQVLRNGDVRITVTGARRVAAVYVFDKQILAAAGQDFVSAGGAMRMDLRPDAAASVISRMQQLGAIFQTKTELETAYEITGLDRPKITVSETELEAAAAEQQAASKPAAPAQPAKAEKQAMTRGDFKTAQTMHAKKRIPLFVATPTRRMPREIYEQVNQFAKNAGGYYSAYQKAGAIPGFQFTSEADRDRFLETVEENNVRFQIREGDVLYSTTGGYTTEIMLADRGNAAVSRLEGELRQRLEKYGMGDVAIRLANQIRAHVNGHNFAAAGRYLRGVIDIALDGPENPMDVLDHEVIHAMRALGVFTDKEWSVLSAKAVSDWLAAYKIESAYAGAPRLVQIEEAIAHAFADKARAPRGLIGKIRRKVQNFLEALRNALRGLGFRSAEDIFSDVQRGEVGNRKRRRPFKGVRTGDKDLFMREAAQEAPASVVAYDNPGGEWLAGKVRRAEEAMKDAPRNSAISRGFVGSTTAYTRKAVNLPVADVAVLPGASGERRRAGDIKFDALSSIVREEGWRDDSPILIGVNHKGEPYIIEGNTRAAVARQQGVPYIRAEVHWYNGAEAAAGAFTPAKVEAMARGVSDARFAAAWHGSPYQFDRFLTEHIGNGEGAQAYGWGLYFASKREIAEHYRQKLRRIDTAAFDSAGLQGAQRRAAETIARATDPTQPEAAARDFAQWTGLKMTDDLVGMFRVAMADKGHLYKVVVPDDNMLFEWDTRLSDMDEKIRKTILRRWKRRLERGLTDWRKIYVEWPNSIEQLKGSQIYRLLAYAEKQAMGGYQTSGGIEKYYNYASEALLSAGIPGLRYLDRDSRGADDGTYNYVIFDDQHIEIEERFALRRAPRTVEETQRVQQGMIARGQPLDRVMRLPFALIGKVDHTGRWIPGVKAYDAAAKAIVEWKPKKGSLLEPMSGILETARQGLIDRYALDEEYISADRRRTLRKREILAQAEEIIHTLARGGVGPDEAKVLQAMLTGEQVTEGDMAKLAEPIREAVDQLGEEAVLLGLISRESFERNRGAYLHRVYQKYEGDENAISRWASRVLSNRRKKIIGEQSKGRGIFLEVPMARVVRDDPDWWKARRGKPVNGERFRILTYEPPIRNLMDPTVEEPAKRQRKQRVFVPADRPIPARYSDWTDRGTFEVRGQKAGKLTLWRDYTKQERMRMGEIVDARYTIAKTFMLYANDLSSGRFYKEIAENEEWATKQPPPDGTWADPTRAQRFWGTGDIQWVRVPTTTIAKSGGKKRWGALAGMYVRAEIWRDLNEVDIMSTPGLWRRLLTNWKLNKTARSPVVHMNNIMSNFVFMDLADIRMQDLIAGIRSFVTKDEHYDDALRHGAFGADMMTQEIRDNILRPLLKELTEAQRKDPQMGPLARIGALGRIAETIWNAVWAADAKMVNAYRMEDEIFRMATYMRRREFGDTAEQAADFARQQFLDYDIRAPWVNMARNSVLPFVSYIYRAAPLIARSLAYHPWKLPKYFLIAYVLDTLAYAIDDEGDEERERASMPEHEQGRTWVGVPRMLRMPFRDANGLPVFLDIRRWIPAGDIFDTTQGSAAVPIPAPLMFGGPVMLGAELMLNKQGFTGKEITDPQTDTTGEKFSKLADWAWKSWTPSAAWVPGSWYWEKIGNALYGATDSQGRPYGIGTAVASSVGIKLKPVPVDDNLSWRMWELRQVERKLKAEGRRLGRQRERNLISERAYNEGMQRVLQKLERLGEEGARLGEIAGGSESEE